MQPLHTRRFFKTFMRKKIQSVCRSQAILLKEHFSSSDWGGGNVTLTIFLVGNITWGRGGSAWQQHLGEAHGPVMHR